MKKLVFDTLGYATMLSKGGVEHSDVHASSLAEAITQNMYVKPEVDRMIEDTFKRFDNSLKSFDERTHQMQLEMKEVENRFEKTMNETVKRLTINFGFISTLLVAVASVVHYIH